MSLYEVLGAAPDASAEELHSAYRARARELHPDVSGADADDAAMRELNDAWALLGDPELRAEYDALFVESGAGVPPRWVQRAPVVITLVVLLLIFVLTAYAGSGTQVLRR